MINPPQSKSQGAVFTFAKGGLPSHLKGREMVAELEEIPPGIVDTLNDDYYKYLLDAKSGEKSLTIKCMPRLGHHIVMKIKPEIILNGREVSLKTIWHCSLWIGLQIMSTWPEIEAFKALKEEFGNLGDLGTNEDKELGEFLTDTSGFKLGTMPQLAFLYGEEPRKLLTTLYGNVSENQQTVATIACFAAFSEEPCLAEETREKCRIIVKEFRNRVSFRHLMGEGGMIFLRRVKAERIPNGQSEPPEGSKIKNGIRGV